MTPLIQKFFEELDMKSFTHAWLKFHSAGLTFIGQIDEYRFIGNHLTLNLTCCAQVREYTVGELGQRKWSNVRSIGDYSFSEILRIMGNIDSDDDSCTLVSTSSDENTSVFTLKNGDEIVLTNDENKVKEIEDILNG